MDNSSKQALFILHKVLVDIRNFAHANETDRIAALADCAELIPELIVTLEGEQLVASVKALLEPFDNQFGHLLRRAVDSHF